jgi:RNA polymerase sigma-70 factor (ECF subfamily)
MTRVPASAPTATDLSQITLAELDAKRRFEVQYLEDGRSLHCFLLKVARGDRWLADDLFQEAMLRAWRFRTAMPHTSQEARKWMFVVARNVAIDAGRRRRRRPETFAADLDIMTTAARDDIGDALAAGALQDAFARLSSAQREALSIVSIGGESVEGAARKLGVAPGTIKSRVHYGLRRLRQAIMGSDTN